MAEPVEPERAVGRDRDRRDDAPVGERADEAEQADAARPSGLTLD